MASWRTRRSRRSWMRAGRRASTCASRGPRSSWGAKLSAGQTRQALENVKAVLAVAGSALERVVKCTVFLSDIRDYAAMNAVYATYFPKDPPARSTVAGSGLALGARVEIECLAVTG